MDERLPDKHPNPDGLPGFPLRPNEYFGRKWNAPAFDNAIEVEVPLGGLCLFCSDLIDSDDSGLMVDAILATGPHRAPVHIECHLRSILGPLAHLEQRCVCFGGVEHDPPTRANAQAVMAWIINQQTDRGLSDPGFAD